MEINQDELNTATRENRRILFIYVWAYKHWEEVLSMKWTTREKFCEDNFGTSSYERDIYKIACLAKEMSKNGENHYG